MRVVMLTQDLLVAMNTLVPALLFDREAMAAALSPDLLATAHALRKVQSGVPFRDAYREAAQELPDLQMPPAADVLAAYATPGTPGHGQPELIHEAAAAHRAGWLEA